MSNSVFALTDKVAIITGGGTGIGRAIAIEFARAGADVVVASRKIENLEKVAGEVRALGRRALAVATDVRKPEDVDNMVKRTMEEFGRIDILVNNHGASFGCALEDMTPGGWDVVMNIDLRGVYLCSRAVGKVMIQQKKGRILNIASVAGVYGSPMMAHYGAAKAGVINFTKSLAGEWAKHGITVNCIAPGPILTAGYQGVREEAGEGDLKGGFNALNRWGRPEEIAYPAIFIASEAASFMTGETICVDGGMSPLRQE
jgi:NAD(P)-dependent dehydrogenase (short-subunit alcohol dehydrogenase family)